MGSTWPHRIVFQNAGSSLSDSALFLSASRSSKTWCCSVASGYTCSRGLCRRQPSEPFPLGGLILTERRADHQFGRTMERRSLSYDETGESCSPLPVDR